MSGHFQSSKSVILNLSSNFASFFPSSSLIFLFVMELSFLFSPNLSFPQPVAKQLSAMKLSMEWVTSGKQAVSICSFNTKAVSRWIKAKSKCRLDSSNKGWIETFFAARSWCRSGSVDVWVSHSPPRALKNVRSALLRKNVLGHKFKYTGYLIQFPWYLYFFHPSSSCNLIDLQ